jgi:hypothetical protein
MTDGLDIPAFLKRKPSKAVIPTSDRIVRQERIITVPASWSKGYVEPEPEVSEDVIERPKAYQPTIQERIKEKHSNMIGELEGMLDDGVITADWSMYQYLTKLGATPMSAMAIANKYRPVAAELLDVLTELEDEQLQEGYEKYTVEEVEDLVLIYQTIVDDCERFASVNKKITKARKKKPVSKEKLLKGFQYLASDNTYKIASIEPSKIIGAQELWTFNVKSKLLSVYRAVDRGGLSVKGTAILNFDEKTSTSKTIGRKTAERIESVLKGGKVVLRKLMDDINGKGVEPKRLNKQTVLLKVI